MPQSLSVVYLHLVFSTKERRPFLRDKSQRLALHALGLNLRLRTPVATPLGLMMKSVGHPG